MYCVLLLRIIDIPIMKSITAIVKLTITAHFVNLLIICESALFEYKYQSLDIDPKNIKAARKTNTTSNIIY